MSTKIFVMRRTKPPKPVVVDPIAEAAAAVEAARQAKQAENKRVMAELFAEDLERRARALAEAAAIPRPLPPLPEDWLDWPPTTICTREQAHRMYKFMKKNLQTEPLGEDMERIQKLMNVASADPSMVKFLDYWIDYQRQTAKTHNIEVSDEEIRERSVASLAAIFSDMHDLLLDKKMPIKATREKQPYATFGRMRWW